MEPLWIAIAFLVGLAVKQFRLPPLIGFLAAGFVLSAMGVENTEVLYQLADIGVYLLLFSIGLKLDLRGLAKPEVWGVTSLHMLVTTASIGALVFGLSWVGLGMFAELNFWTALMVAFALSFSSTVFAVKVLEEKSEMGSRHGDQAIGVLIMQDIFAIVFLTASTGKIPSPWALLLLGLPLLRWPLRIALDRAGHGELLLLLGMLMVFGSGALFELVQMKPDLGALIAGILLGSHPKANEMAKSLMSLKDLFLVAFFLTIGLQGLPDLQQIGVAALFVLLLPAKVLLFFWLMTRFRLRARTATLSTLALANYSEFGLIVGAVGVSAGWISGQWLVTVAIALSLSFIVAAPFNAKAHIIFRAYADRLQRFETAKRLPDDQHITLDVPVRAIVIGMGRVGTAAYDSLREQYGEHLIGLDVDQDIARSVAAGGRQIICGDATDPDFYSRLSASSSCELVVIALQYTGEVVAITRLLRESGFAGHISAMARFADEIEELRDAGVDAPHYLHEEMGIGLARSAVADMQAMLEAGGSDEERPAA
jgi:predicted Kef-type K+ transport protein